MSLRLPIVNASEKETPLQQLQPGDDLQIPLETRFQELKMKYACLILWLVEQRFPVPSDQLEYTSGIKL